MFEDTDLKKKIPLYVLITVAIIWVLFPLYWTISTAFKPSNIVHKIPPNLIIQSFSLKHFPHLFEIAPFGKGLLNSAIITGGTLAITIPVGTTAAYGLSRYKFPGSDGVFGFIIGARMIPPVAFVVPLFLLVLKLGLLDTWWGIMLSHLTITLPFTIWIMKGFFDELPTAFEEAAMVDGASRFGAMKVAMRLAMPGILVSLIFSFKYSWNNFLFSLVLSRSPASKPVPVVLSGMLQVPYQVPWGEITAGILIYLIPAFVLAYYAEKYIARIYVMGTTK